MEKQQVVLEAETKVAAPCMYAVVLINDDVTTMDFVVALLMEVFKKTSIQASVIMMHVHEKGSGVAGIYTYDIAFTKKTLAEKIARREGFPLRLEVEPVE